MGYIFAAWCSRGIINHCTGTYIEVGNQTLNRDDFLARGVYIHQHDIWPVIEYAQLRLHGNLTVHKKNAPIHSRSSNYYISILINSKEKNASIITIRTYSAVTHRTGENMRMERQINVTS